MPEAACKCSSTNPRFDQFRPYIDVGVDETQGRFADVSVDECANCGALWLRYHVEYEGFSRSGRWARGRIDLKAAEAITPERASDLLAELPDYVCGGSYLDAHRNVGSGRMYWGV